MDIIFECFKMHEAMKNRMVDFDGELVHSPDYDAANFLFSDLLRIAFKGYAGIDVCFSSPLPSEEDERVELALFDGYDDVQYVCLHSYHSLVHLQYKGIQICIPAPILSPEELEVLRGGIVFGFVKSQEYFIHSRKGGGEQPNYEKFSWLLDRLASM